MADNKKTETPILNEQQKRAFIDLIDSPYTTKQLVGLRQSIGIVFPLLAPKPKKDDK